MQAQTLDIELTNGARRPTKAYAPDAAPGLVVHRALGKRDAWTVAHAPTSHRIGPDWPTRKLAAAAARYLTRVGSWDRPASEIMGDRRYGEHARTLGPIRRDATPEAIALVREPS